MTSRTAQNAAERRYGGPSRSKTSSKSDWATRTLPLVTALRSPTKPKPKECSRGARAKDLLRPRRRQRVSNSSCDEAKPHRRFTAGRAGRNQPPGVAAIGRPRPPRQDPRSWLSLGSSDARACSRGPRPSPATSSSGFRVRDSRRGAVRSGPSKDGGWSHRSEAASVQRQHAIAVRTLLAGVQAIETTAWRIGMNLLPAPPGATRLRLKWGLAPHAR